MERIIKSISNKVIELAEKNVEINPEVYSPFFFVYEISLVDTDE